MSQKPPPPLRPIQRQAAEFLAKGLTASRTAQNVGVRRETICRWKQDPRFRQLVESYRDEFHETAMRRMPELFDAAVLALSDELRNGPNTTWAALMLLRMFGADRLALPPSGPHPLILEDCTKP